MKEMHITELRLMTDSLQEQRNFYARTLGLTLVDETEEVVTMQAGASRLVFVQADAGTHPFYHFAFNIPGNKFALAKAWLAQRCPLLEMNGIDQVTHQNWNAQSFYFYDPVGNIVEFIARYNLSINRAGAFDQSDLLNVSEIGLVVDDVPSTIEPIEHFIGEHIWKEQSDTFTTIGNDHGLLVLAQVGRIWLLTNKPSEVHPVRVTIQGSPIRTFRFADLPYHITLTP
jgi:catechol 2,3-dioxygenase-like lactoylglutathione lyase family enzyme